MKRGVVNVYRDATRQWRWNAVAANGRLVADGGESYRRRADAVKQAERAELAWNFRLVIHDGKEKAMRKTKKKRGPKGC